jgi:hypothetical protein
MTGILGEQQDATRQSRPAGFALTWAWIPRRAYPERRLA